MDIESFLHRENLQLASISKRITALGLDALVIFIFLIVIDYSAWSTASSFEEIMAVTQQFSFMYLVIAFAYHALFVTLYGATLGKIAVKIRVISLQTGDTPDLPTSVMRSAIRLISESFFLLGFIWGLMDPNRQTWHDKLPRTLVIDV